MAPTGTPSQLPVVPNQDVEMEAVVDGASVGVPSVPLPTMEVDAVPEGTSEVTADEPATGAAVEPPAGDVAGATEGTAMDVDGAIDEENGPASEPGDVAVGQTPSTLESDKKDTTMMIRLDPFVAGYTKDDKMDDTTPTVATPEKPTTTTSNVDPTTPERPKSTLEPVAKWRERLLEAFDKNADALQDFAKATVPEITSLEKDAMSFILSIFGGGSAEEETLPLSHATVPLASFLPICTSMRFAAVAEQKMGKTEEYQLSLNYFAGYQEKTKTPYPEDEAVAQCLEDFFVCIFSHPEHENIARSVRRSRSLFITAKSFKDPSKKKKNKKKKLPLASDREAEPPEETVVACLNFALIPGHGFFVNWLATSDEKIDASKYGVGLVTS